MSACARLALLIVAILTTGAIGCGSSPPRDQNYGTTLGADFVAPVVDAGSDAAGGGTGGAATSETAGAGGTEAAAGSAGTDAAAGAGGTGS